MCKCSVEDKRLNNAWHIGFCFSRIGKAPSCRSYRRIWLILEMLPVAFSALPPLLCSPRWGCTYAASSQAARAVKAPGGQKGPKGKNSEGTTTNSDRDPKPISKKKLYLGGQIFHNKLKMRYFFRMLHEFAFQLCNIWTVHQNSTMSW